MSSQVLHQETLTKTLWYKQNIWKSQLIKYNLKNFSFIRLSRVHLFGCDPRSASSLFCVYSKLFISVTCLIWIIQHHNTGIYKTGFRTFRKSVLHSWTCIFQNTNRALSCTAVINVSLTKYSRQIIIRKNAPIKNKYVKANQSGFINKNLRKAIMRRSSYAIYFSRRKQEKLTIHNEKNDCVNALENKKDCFVNWNINKITAKKKFWKPVKLFFDKLTINNSLTKQW